MNPNTHIKSGSATLLLLTLILAGCGGKTAKTAEASYSFSKYDELVTLFNDWRKFQAPEIKDGVPDYSTDAMKKQHAELAGWQKKLNSFDTTGWPIRHQIDWYLVWAEMNGLDFDHRVLRPWERDPAFYVWFHAAPSDVPAREGPNIHGTVELPAYKQPISAADAREISRRLLKAADVYAQARKNLTGNGRDLWVLGARSIREQSSELEGFAASVAGAFPDLAKAALTARDASNEFAGWLDEQAATKTGPSGIGKENYDWYVANVHLSPYSWAGERQALERELARSHSALRFAEHKNRKLQPLQKAATPEAYRKRLHEGLAEYMQFLDQQEILTVKPYMEPAMRAQIHDFVPADGIRGFFDEVDYRDPMPMRAHHYHWIEKAREIEEPNESPIRRVPLLYNIFDSRAEGMATAMEELVMNAGLLANRPQAPEMVYIMLAQRSARGLGGLYQHSNDMNFDQATKYASKWVPWGLLPAHGGTIQHEEHFYLEQPGYGSSYVVGKLDIDRLIAEYARQREGKFRLREFMDEFNRVGIIPVSLVYWEMTGDKSLLNRALGK